MYWRRLVNYSEFLGVVITLALLPIDRFPYIHHVPLSLGFISLVLLLIAVSGRLLNVWSVGRFGDLRRYFFFGTILALPVAAYALSSTYAIDRSFTLGATKDLLSVTLRAFCFFVLVSERPQQLWLLVKKTIYVVSAIVVAYAFFQFFFDVFGISTK